MYYVCTYKYIHTYIHTHTYMSTYRYIRTYIRGVFFRQKNILSFKMYCMNIYLYVYILYVFCYLVLGSEVMVPFLRLLALTTLHVRSHSSPAGGLCHTYIHTYIHRYMHTYIHTSILDNVHTYIAKIVLNHEPDSIHT